MTESQIDRVWAVLVALIGTLFFVCGLFYAGVPQDAVNWFALLFVMLTMFGSWLLALALWKIR